MSEKHQIQISFKWLLHKNPLFIYFPSLILWKPTWIHLLTPSHRLVHNIVIALSWHRRSCSWVGPASPPLHPNVDINAGWAISRRLLSEWEAAQAAVPPYLVHAPEGWVTLSQTRVQKPVVYLWFTQVVFGPPQLIRGRHWLYFRRFLSLNVKSMPDLSCLLVCISPRERDSHISQIPHECMKSPNRWTPSALLGFTSLWKHHR